MAFQAALNAFLTAFHPADHSVLTAVRNVSNPRSIMPKMIVWMRPRIAWRIPPKIPLMPSHARLQSPVKTPTTKSMIPLKIFMIPSMMFERPLTNPFTASTIRSMMNVITLCTMGSNASIFGWSHSATLMRMSITLPMTGASFSNAVAMRPIAATMMGPAISASLPISSPNFGRIGSSASAIRLNASPSASAISRMTGPSVSASFSIVGPRTLSSFATPSPSPSNIGPSCWNRLLIDGPTRSKKSMKGWPTFSSSMAVSSMNDARSGAICSTTLPTILIIRPSLSPTVPSTGSSVARALLTPRNMSVMPA